jgi:hypothetical protein
VYRGRLDDRRLSCFSSPHLCSLLSRIDL